MSVHASARKVTTHTLQEMKREGERITMLTAYDFSLAKLVDNAGVDVILVGDSASNVMAGQVTTVPITLEHMIYHAQCVQRAVDRALIVVDLPFGTYQGNSRLALESSIRIMKEAEAHAVKLEGGAEIVDSIRRILSAGIPVMGHLGLTPQSIYKFGTYTVRAKEEEEATKLIEDAKMLEEAGCFAVVLEKIPRSLAAQGGIGSLDPGHRHRCGCGGGRTGPGVARHARHLHGLLPAIPPSVSEPQRIDRWCDSSLLRGCSIRILPQ